MTLAPELPGASELIVRLLERGVTVSLGHSDATAEQAEAAFDLGVRTVTHLFNAMRPFLHRDPGIVGAALARDDVVVQLILDGVHLSPETVKVAWRAAPGRVALVTDAISAAGVSEGDYSFGSLDVSVRDGTVRGPDGVLAGSVLTMIEAVRNLHELGVPLAGAVEAATAVPARASGPDRARPARRGSSGRRARARRRRADRARARRRRRARGRLKVAGAVLAAAALVVAAAHGDPARRPRSPVSSARRS